MFNANRIMIIYDDDRLALHLNGKEIYRIYEAWDALDAFSLLCEKMNTNLNSKPYKFYHYYASDIEISDEARDLLYDVQQFTQAEEKAFIEADWNILNQLLLQRVEDDDIE